MNVPMPITPPQWERRARGVAVAGLAVAGPAADALPSTGGTTTSMTRTSPQDWKPSLAAASTKAHATPTTIPATLGKCNIWDEEDDECSDV